MLSGSFTTALWAVFCPVRSAFSCTTRRAVSAVANFLLFDLLGFLGCATGVLSGLCGSGGFHLLCLSRAFGGKTCLLLFGQPSLLYS